MILLGEDRDVTSENAPEVARALADAIASRSVTALGELVTDMRRAAGDPGLDADLRATAALQADAIERFLAGEDPFPPLLRMSRVVGRANDDPSFDWRRALFELNGSEN
jgi:hypothetical protein